MWGVGLNIQKKDIERAYIIDRMTQEQARKNRSAHTAAKTVAEKIYSDTGKKQETRNKAEERRMNEAIVRVGQQYGSKEEKVARNLIRMAWHNRQVYEFVMERIERAEQNPNASYERIAEALGIVAKTWDRITNKPMYDVDMTNQWRIAVSLKLTPEEAEAFRVLCRTSVREYDCVLQLCFELAQHDPAYYDREKIDDMLALWFGDEKFKKLQIND